MDLPSCMSTPLMTKSFISIWISKDFLNYKNFNTNGEESFSLSFLKATSQSLVYVIVFFNKFDKGLEILEKL